MKKKLFTLLSLLALVCTGAWGDDTVYSWESPSGTVSETGGTIAYNAGSDAGKYDEFNYTSSTIAGTLYVIKLQ